MKRELELVVVLASLACAAAAESLKPVLPDGLDSLEPAVRQLIVRHAEALRATPDDAGAWGELGLVYEANVLWAEARTCFERAAELDSGNVLWRFHRAVATQESGDFIAALAQLDSSHRGAHHRLGLALRATGRQEEARRSLARGVGAVDRMLPNPLTEKVARYAVHLTARINRATGLLASRRPAEARDLLELCLVDHPENVTVLNNLAIAHFGLAEATKVDAAVTWPDGTVRRLTGLPTDKAFVLYHY